ncbi:MAG TPA: hypothetical protein VGQ42_02200 [Candidatus Dormibacteraeota bacterium]|jgi:hypothetical protein|nr:hypothetical protein [Candidatus Dormibacteraeota bacterium]
MSLRSAIRGVVFASVAAGAAFSVVVAVTRPRLRQRALELIGQRVEPQPQQPTHIVLPDRFAEPDWVGLDDAVEEGTGIVTKADIALAGA